MREDVPFTSKDCLICINGYDTPLRSRNQLTGTDQLLLSVQFDDADDRLGNDHTRETSVRLRLDDRGNLLLLGALLSRVEAAKLLSEPLVVLRFLKSLLCRVQRERIGTHHKMLRIGFREDVLIVVINLDARIKRRSR